MFVVAPTSTVIATKSPVYCTARISSGTSTVSRPCILRQNTRLLRMTEKSNQALEDTLCRTDRIETPARKASHRYRTERFNLGFIIAETAATLQRRKIGVLEPK